MSIKKLCSIGLLNIKLNLTLRQSFAENNNFNIDEYNSIEDLEKLFYPKIDLNADESNNNSIDYINYISLSSDDNLLNTLLFINRAYKTKTFIEFLIPNEIKFNKNNYFLKSFINEILYRNYFFVVENNIINETSKIKLIIKILKDNNDEIISKKEFNLIEERDKNENDIFNNEYFETYKLNYDFNKNEYFFIDIDSIKLLKWKTYNDLYLFILNIIKNIKIKIILSINKDSLICNNNKINRDKETIYDILDINKNIIECSDIIFCFKNSINNFLREYSIKNRTKIIKINGSTQYRVRSSTYNRHSNNFKQNSELFVKNNIEDLIRYDNNKFRKQIPRLSLILDDFDYLTLYNQEFDESSSIEISIEPYNEIFCFSLLNKNHTNKEFRENINFLSNNSDKCFHIFIAGFLSRFINNIDLSGNVNSYEECFIAGNLLLKNYLILLKNNIDYITDVDEYNVVVPKIKKCLKERLYKQKKEELRKIRKKEQKFILDCINSSKSQKKNYNSLLDVNCSSYLTKKNILNHLTKNNFINQDGKILKDPGSSRQNNSINKFLNKIGKFNYYNLYNKIIYKKEYSPTPLLVNHSNRLLNTDNKKIIFKRIFESNEDKKNTINNNNSSNNKIANNSSKYLYKNKTLYNKTPNTYRTNKATIKIPFIHKIKKSFDGIKEKDYIKTNRKSIERFDTMVNYYGKDYNEYLFKLYQPKKNYKNFLNNYESNFNFRMKK